jgi:hypothetical protein
LHISILASKNPIFSGKIKWLNLDHKEKEGEFEELNYPFSDLFTWSVLTKRQDMAICMWEHGEEALAKV